MKSLYLFRHGKSNWKADYDGDHERPLARRGVRGARTMGRFLSRAGQAPERILCSTAVRCRETLDLATEAGRWTASAELVGDLYKADPWTVIRLVRVVEGPKRAMVIGHEPTLSELVERFTGANARFVTAAVARIDFDVDAWSEIEPGGGTLIWFLPPKTLTRGDFDFAESPRKKKK